jgi:hypothetical protein
MKFSITYAVFKNTRGNGFGWAVYRNGVWIRQDSRKSLRGALSRAKACAERIAAEHAHFKTNDVTVEMCDWSLK